MQALPEEAFFAVSPWLDDQSETLNYDKLKQHARGDLKMKSQTHYQLDQQSDGGSW